MNSGHRLSFAEMNWVAVIEKSRIRVVNENRQGKKGCGSADGHVPLVDMEMPGIYRRRDGLFGNLKLLTRPEEERWSMTEKIRTILNSKYRVVDSHHSKVTNSA